MADTSAEKLQNMNIQDFDGSEFDPFAPQGKMANMNKGEQPVDLLGECFENAQMTNGSDKHVSFDQEAGIGLPDPTYINQGQGQGQISGFEGQRDEGLQRHMSEGEILGYQNEYGESIMTGQVEYTGDSEEEDGNNLIDIEGSDVDSYMQKGQGHTGGGNVGEYSSPDPSQNYDEYVENDYVDDNDEGVQAEGEHYDGPVDYDDDQIDPDSWHPQMDPERLRRSKSPERSVSPYVKSESGGDVDSDMISSPSEMSHPEPVGGASYRESSIPKSEGVETPDLISQGSQQLSSEETESLDSRSETEGTPRRRRIPKPKTKKPLELPPWDDNVVVPKLPRMKPTLIGKQADLPPPSPPQFRRPRTAPARHNAKDASSDSGVEEEAKSPRKSSGDVKKKYGTDTKNERYKPGGGNIQVFSQRVDTRSVTPRTDTTKPRSALSPRISPSKEKAPLTPKAPTPDTKHVQSKIGSLNNVKHSPGGGNVKVLNAKVDFSNVHSKVGSKDKLGHKPKGGDKKIESQKLTWQTESKVGSLKNVTHSPGGGNLKDSIDVVQGTMNTRENIDYQPGGGNVPEPYEEELDWDADAKVNTLDNLGYEPGGGCVKIFSEKLNWKAEPKVDTGLHSRSENILKKPGNERYDSSKQQVAITIEPVPDRFNHSYLEPVPEVEYQSAADVKNNQGQMEPIRASATDYGPIKDTVVDQTDGSYFINDKTTKALDQDWKQGQPPPPKPPRCSHKEWALEERTVTDVDSDKPDEREILTFTKEELDEILRKRDLVESQEKGILEPGKYGNELYENQRDQPDELNDEITKENINCKYQEDIPISGRTNDDEFKNRSVDHKEDTVVLERMIIEKYDEKENVDISKKTKPKKKSGFVNKMKGLFSASKSKETKDTEKDNKRFSNTSYNINRSNSNSSRISVKGKKLKGFANEEQKEVELMVKYLGYHSPKLARKTGTEAENDEKGIESKKEKKKQIVKKKHLERSEPVEKLANLGYKSPKLAKKGGKSLVMTGSPSQKRMTGLESKGIVGETAKCFSDENDRVDLLEKENVTRIHVKEGVNSDYQDIDFGTNVSDVKNGKSLETLVAYGGATDIGILQSRKFEKTMQGTVNEGYEYDDVASDEDTEGSDSDENSEDERHVSVAELKVNTNRDSKKGIQTTTFKYQTDLRPTSPLNVVRQEVVESLEYNFPNVEDRCDVERELNETLVMKENLTQTTAHDKFGYAVVHKKEDTNLVEVGKMSRGSGKSETYNQKKGEESFKAQEVCFERSESREIKKEALCESRSKYERKSRSDQDLEHELTLEEELRTVLANIQDNDCSFLKSPRRHEGTATGSRPGTPKIQVKPLWMKAEEEGKVLGSSGRYGMRRYMSDENLSRPSQQKFVRSNRTQSMMVRTHGTLETGSGAIKVCSGTDSVALHPRGGSNLARSSEMINLSGTQHVVTACSADDLRQDSMATASEFKTALSSAKFTSRNEGSISSEISGVGENATLKSNENSGTLASESFSRGSFSRGSFRSRFYTGVSEDTDLCKSENFSAGSVNKNLTGDCFERYHGPSNTEEVTNMVVKQRLSWSAKSRVGSLENATHSPGGGKVKILDQKIEIKAQSKIGSTANIKHKPGGGDKKIETQKLEFKDSARSKVGSMDKVKHRPGGGDIKIHDEKLKWETTSKVKSLENAEHVPGGGCVKIVDEKPVWTAESKVESLVNADHVPGGGQVKILDEKVDFSNTAKPKVGSMDKVKHQPGGGDKKIETQKLNFKETAKARTDTGASTGEKQSSQDQVRSGSVTSSQDGSVQE